ncbi:MAG: glycosyltransferase [Verrucomicrobia bacterium]|nr:glycosyltransferase [Verrucomicrobiota bacterium]
MREFPSLKAYFDWVAANRRKRHVLRTAFHRQLQALHRQRIPEGVSVLEWGCGSGEVLSGLKPSRGVGLDFSEGMIATARELHADDTLVYRVADVEKEPINEAYDYIVMNYLIGYLPDVQAALANLTPSSHTRTRLVLTSLNHLWQWPLKWAQWLGLVTPQPPSNWLTTDDLVNLLELAGWEVVEKSTEQLCPLGVPLLAPFLNRVVARLPFFKHLGVTLMLTARPHQRTRLENTTTCSVIVPARNEAGNIRPALERIAPMGALTEVIFVEGNSTDDTWATIEREIAAYGGPLRVRAIKQPGKGKWDAVRAGFEIATGEILVIQDADLTAPPEDLPKFFAAICDGSAEFANGSRLVYPMEKQAMQFLNFFGNKFFALSLSYVLGQPIKDSLCGTKMLLKSDYERILERIKPLGDFDPFGDFNLLFGASLLNLKIRDIPVRYKDRTYGETNISRFKHGWLLLKMTAFGLLRLKWR